MRSQKHSKIRVIRSDACPLAISLTAGVAGLVILISSCSDRQHLDAAFLTSGRKPWKRDHMGFLIEGEDGSFDVIEASGSAGRVVRRPWDLTPFAKWSDGFRRLTIGE